MSIDYGCGLTNIDKSNGIRYGVIGQNDVDLDVMEFSVEYDYARGCPKCGNDVVEYDEEKHGEFKVAPRSCCDFACEGCEMVWDSSEVYGDEAIGFHSTDKDYVLEKCLDFDMFVIRSPFYTRAEFCSPCVPGACSITSPNPDGAKCYCLGHDFFDGGVAPYPIYRVDNDELVESKAHIEDAIRLCTQAKFDVATALGIEPGPEMMKFSDSDAPICRVIRYLQGQL